MQRTRRWTLWFHIGCQWRRVADLEGWAAVAHIYKYEDTIHRTSPVVGAGSRLAVTFFGYRRNASWRRSLCLLVGRVASCRAVDFLRPALAALLLGCVAR